MAKHISWDCKYEFNSLTYDSNQKWNNKTCQYGCGSWNPSTCICEHC